MKKKPLVQLKSAVQPHQIQLQLKSYPRGRVIVMYQIIQSLHYYNIYFLKSILVKTIYFEYILWYIWMKILIKLVFDVIIYILNVRYNVHGTITYLISFCSILQLFSLHCPFRTDISSTKSIERSCQTSQMRSRTWKLRRLWHRPR